MGNLLTPPNYSPSKKDRIVFLAGPIQGAPDWQTPFAETLLSQVPDVDVASPRRTRLDEESFNYAEQVAWEKHYLERAAKLGGEVIFWFAAQDHSLAYEAGRSYAQTTRVEIGRIFGWRDYDPSVSIHVGFDPEYTPNGGGSQRYIESLCDENGLTVHRSLESIADTLKTIT